MAKRIARTGRTSEGNGFRHPDSIAHTYPTREEPEDPEVYAQAAALCPRCSFEGCEQPQFYDMPVCLGHLSIIQARLKEIRLLRQIKQIEPPQPVKHGEPFVYYLMLGPATVKIGTTVNLRQRLSQLRTDAQYVVALEFGGLDVERQRHLEFAAERYGVREDFRLSDRLKMHIESLQPKRDELMRLALQHGGYRPDRATA